jgi:hypothetical protein
VPAPTDLGRLAASLSGLDAGVGMPRMLDELEDGLRRKAYLVVPDPIGEAGFEGGYTGLGLYSRKPRWWSLIGRRMYRVSVPPDRTKGLSEATSFDVRCGGGGVGDRLLSLDGIHRGR